MQSGWTESQFTIDRTPVPRQYECSKCGETGYKERLVEHFFRKHVPDKGVPWLCTLCGYKAVSHEEITRHTHYRRHRQAKERWPRRRVEYQKSAHPYEVKIGTDIKVYQQDKPNYHPMQTYEYDHCSVRNIVKPTPKACLNEKSSDSHKAMKRSRSRSDGSEEEPKNKISKPISEAEKDEGGNISSQRDRQRGENENRDSHRSSYKESRCEKSSGDEKHSLLRIINEKAQTPPETATSEEDSKNRKSKSISKAEKDDGGDVSSQRDSRRGENEKREGQDSKDSKNKKSKSISRALSETAINASTSNATEDILKKQASVVNAHATNTSISHKKKDEKGEELSADDNNGIFNQEELADLDEEEFGLMPFLNPVKNISKALIAIERHLRKLVPVAERLNARRARNQSYKKTYRK